MRSCNGHGLARPSSGSTSVPPPAMFYAILPAIVTYLAMVEVAKKGFTVGSAHLTSRGEPTRRRGVRYRYAAGLGQCVHLI